MKRLSIFVVLILFIFAIPCVYGASVKGEEMVTSPAPATPIFVGSETVPAPPGATTAEIKAIVGEVSKEVKNLKGSLVGKDGAIPKLDVKVSGLAGSTKDLANATREIAAATRQNADSLKILDKAVEKTAARTENRVISCIINNAWLLGIILSFGFIILLFLYYRNRKQNIRIWNPVAQTISKTDHTATDIMSAVKDIDGKVDAIIKNVKEVPAETARLVKEFDSKPFEFDVAGHNVTYTSPAEGISEGYYRTLQITEMPDGKDHPETFERQTETKRGLTLNYIRGTIKKYLEGKLKGKPEETLINYLLKPEVGELKIS